MTRARTVPAMSVAAWCALPLLVRPGRLARAPASRIAAALVLTLAAAWPESLSGQRDDRQHRSPAPAFTNIAAVAGVRFDHVNGASPDKHLVETMGSGALLSDLDGDGWVDIFLVDGGSLADAAAAGRAQHRLFRLHAPHLVATIDELVHGASRLVAPPLVRTSRLSRDRAPPLFA